MLFTSLLFPTLALASSNLFVRQQRGVACTSDDSCKTPCSTPAIRAEGVNVTPNEQVQAEAIRRFGDAHCIESKCSCAITSDDQAQDFCKYWIENAKEEFNGARYVNGGVDADKGSIYCVYATAA
ncbi:hypothetical protein HII31_12734 [Pseudocercospora fuligena]|uniref:Uncharacterized protein n=1 Tax=Pseudocercospora fuligena TaxID=685502 RepID=A0A8H6R793_9PEZI|nr:hypothetical protein HII31_12734 [Pseudocercospora fuligena]